METMVVQTKQNYSDIMEQNESDSEELYTDLNDWVGTVYLANAAENIEDLSDKMQHLYQAAL